MVEAAAISLVAAAISLGLRGILLVGIVLPAIASDNTRERNSRGTKIISGTRDLSFLEIPLGMITRTTAIMMTMLATIPMDNPQQPK
jgi:hypothetical protein